MLRSPHGFTLVELLVVISVISLIASIVLGSIGTMRSRGEDAKRYSDMRQLSLALDLYANENSARYPSSSGRNIKSVLGALTPLYIKSLPKDPSGGAWSYWYCTNSGNTAYTLLASVKNHTVWCSVSTGTDRCSWSSMFPMRCGR